MFGRLIAALVLTASSGAALAQANAAGAAEDPWGIAAMPNGCMIQATSPQGTMISIWGFAGDSKLGFLLQNRGWKALPDGNHYDLSVDFAGQKRRLVKATAREHIDSDGPGYFFTVEPGNADGSGFLRNFTSAKGMTISREGRNVDTLPLAGSHGAMAAFAKCLSAHWQAPTASLSPDSDDGDDDGDSGSAAGSPGSGPV
ncbi:MAG: hypothetical protein JWP15_3304 [Alphaproteobacteria bacterium]|nr:hypothetical protein [Alphaproteobacteria bacterium]